MATSVRVVSAATALVHCAVDSKGVDANVDGNDDDDDVFGGDGSVDAR